MKIAVDKTNYKQIKDDNNEYIFLFDDEPLEFLMSTNLHCINYNYCNYVDINTTKYNIRCKKNARITDNFQDLFASRDYKIGIIIPNYNYEHTIEKCLESICSQTYKNYEIIFVDDMSTDNSTTIARRIATKYFPNIVIKVIELEQKRYNGGARNEGYLHLSDDVDYVYYVDSDDWLFDNHSLERINIALQKDEPDVLFVGLVGVKNGKIKEERIPDYKDKYEAFKGWSGSCGKVIKKDLAMRQECLYNEGTLKEDRNQHCRICIYMNDFKCLKEPIYVWNQSNEKSITTIRDNIIWGTSTIRHYADTLQLALSVKNKDRKIDVLMEERVRKCKEEIETNGDRQW